MMTINKQKTRKTLLLLVLAMLSVCVGCQSARGPGKPLIGITSVYSANNKNGTTWVDFAYIKAITETGGAPLILPTISEEEIMQRYVDQLDGLVLVGGDDIPPSAYTQQPHETVKIMPMQRYDFERKLISLWWARGKPLLGICLGMQFTNVVSGGSLIQDIPSQVGTTVKHRGYHNVKIDPKSSLAKILNSDQAYVYSNHHQAVKDLGRNLKIIARSKDGIPEAMERTDGKFGLFVQWHPEASDNTEQRNAIYGALVRACAVRIKSSP
ncbi:MAG: gamma-glutamyl-gamma-aminobutyrate hydrolase family protein [Planctomycetota bacterium]